MKGLASNQKMPQSNVQVICDYMGGGFGSKFGAGVHGGLAAELSRQANAPVKLMLTRHDEGLAVGNRPSSKQKLKFAADKDGKLLAAQVENHGSPGVGGGGQTAGGGGGANINTPYLYKFPNFRVQQFGVAMNTGPSSAFRAPGHPPSSFGTEAMMDELAVKLGPRPGRFPAAQRSLRRSPARVQGRPRQVRLGREISKAGSSPGPVKTGVGVAAGTWGGGGKGTKAEVQINADGTVEVRCGTQDLGTGSRTVVALVAAEAFGLKPDQITVRIGDTHLPPSGGSGGSSTTASAGPAIWDACQNALAALQQQSGVADARGANWFGACKTLGITPLTAQGEWQKGLSSSGAGGVNFAEVEVDTETGFIRVKKIVAVHDCGLVVNPLTTMSQINGGVLSGMGYALYEERIMDRQTGLLLNTSFDSYKVPNIADTPDIQIVLLNIPERGIIGIGEPAVIPSAAAIANAVANALGGPRPQPADHACEGSRRTRKSSQRRRRFRMNTFQYVTARTPQEAVELAGKNGRFLAGGIDLLGEMKEYIVSPDVLVNVKEIADPADLGALARSDEKTAGSAFYKLGGTATIAEIAADAGLGQALPGLAEAAGNVGSPQIRNVAFARRQPAPAFPLLVLPPARHRVPEARRDDLLRAGGRKQIPVALQRLRLRQPRRFQSLGHPHRAGCESRGAHRRGKPVALDARALSRSLGQSRRAQFASSA